MLFLRSSGSFLGHFYVYPCVSVDAKSAHGISVCLTRITPILSVPTLSDPQFLPQSNHVLTSLLFPIATTAKTQIQRPGSPKQLLGEKGGKISM